MVCEFCFSGIATAPPGHGIDHHTLHCESRFCIEACDECKDMAKAVGDPEDKREDKKDFTIYLTEDELKDCRKLAEDRQGNKDKNGNSSERFFQDKVEEDYIGIIGEWAFESLTGLPMDKTIKKGGDNGKDFEMGALVVDVKTARKAYNLLVKIDEINRTLADIFIQARFTEPNKVQFIGWETKVAMRLAPRKDMGKGIISHYKPVAELKQMADLLP